MKKPKRRTKIVKKIVRKRSTEANTRNGEQSNPLLALEDDDYCIGPDTRKKKQYEITTIKRSGKDLQRR